jgi:hypothetical protein
MQSKRYLYPLRGSSTDGVMTRWGSMAKRQLTEFEKVQIIAARKAEHRRQFSLVEIDVIVEDYTDEQGNPRVTQRPKS